MSLRGSRCAESGGNSYRVACKYYLRFDAAEPLKMDHAHEEFQAGPGGRTRQPLLLRHPQHRGRGEGCRGARAARPVPEYRRSGRVWLSNPRSSRRNRRKSHARRPQRLCALGRDSRGARGGCGRLHRPRHRDVARSRAHHDRHVGRHRAGAECARGRGRRSARAVADLSALYRGAGEDLRPTSVLPHRS